MSDLLERYRKTFGWKRIKFSSGYIWEIRKMIGADWGVIFGGLITFGGDKEAPPPTERTMEVRRRIFGQCVHGICEDLDGGEVTAVPFEEVGDSDQSEISDYVTSSSPRRLDVADDLGRSL